MDTRQRLQQQSAVAYNVKKLCDNNAANESPQLVHIANGPPVSQDCIIEGCALPIILACRAFTEQQHYYNP